MVWTVVSLVTLLVLDTICLVRGRVRRDAHAWLHIALALISTGTFYGTGMALRRKLGELMFVDSERYHATGSAWEALHSLNVWTMIATVAISSFALAWRAKRVGDWPWLVGAVALGLWLAVVILLRFTWPHRWF